MHYLQKAFRLYTKDIDAVVVLSENVLFLRKEQLLMIWLEKYENFVAAYRAADDKLKKVMMSAQEYYKKKFCPGFLNEFVVITIRDQPCLVFVRNFFLPALETKEGIVEPIEINNIVLPFDEQKFYPAQEIMMQAKIKQ